jgi:hypothetical protein
MTPAVQRALRDMMAAGYAARRQQSAENLLRYAAAADSLASALDAAGVHKRESSDMRERAAWARAKAQVAA